jgi:CRP/FNR family transcriptional regulator, nitrogen fixation regulation protein
MSHAEYHGCRPIYATEVSTFGPGLNTSAVRRGLIGIRKAYASNMEIFGDGEPAEYLYEVVRGSVRSCKILGDGRRQITGFHMPGEVFGLEIDDEHHFSAETVSDAVILAVKRSAIMRLAACDVYFARELRRQGRCSCRNRHAPAG